MVISIEGMRNLALTKNGTGTIAKAFEAPRVNGHPPALTANPVQQSRGRKCVC